MHGWASNEPQVVQDVRDEQKLSKNDPASLCDTNERVLGLYWDRNEDTLSFNVGLNKIRADLANGTKPPTKREFFSVAMSVYDPLGILAPFTLQSKLIMQDIWRSGIKWDGPIREKEFKIWLVWLKNLAEMKNVKIPRCFLFSDFDNVKVQLHIFCDASLKAYATVAYLRMETRDGRVRTALIMSKSRVAPVKPMSVPRLELQAAVLETRLAAMIEKEIEITIHERVFWTDSTTVLHWIRADPSRKQMFVANRLGEIGEATKVAEWRWVPTSLNPADDTTRPSEVPMHSDDRWLVGPMFLLEKPESWPRPKSLNESEKRKINELEARKEFIGTFQIDMPDNWNTLDVRYRVLGWDRIREVATVVRKYFYIWLDNVRKRQGENTTDRATRYRRRHREKSKLKRPIGPPAHRRIESEEDRLRESENVWFRVIQASLFSHEMALLEKGKELPRGSKLISLDPIVDEKGLLRARGRVVQV
ncbi:uncharacterized protein LOC131675218 [Phymastichus coffea]|uniref:uncharacterized protein LOC131675218 n=1 Tax=Phymastichus coffea TaxID=108790 RepID=UPI00273BEAF0|nr:uncharacterized protein LOC131675218 [Phymastichus coffea]